ncbi:deazaflavin-dependent oxidoreductase, nitroreductase family [Pedococcus cremeus]|uniref:Deazaflavin-dependent oxidoreductase, nitroreductase family n=2 Tax=Pedococcus cremeus TaxID=587636 RepID=A0A1H9VV81_9MICO|nr:deazaflavin-dependent oxidoreductase, nitroreductase family [Pedococcus cremeus]
MAVARFNRRVTNRVTTPVLRRLPGFGVVHHVGRRSGRPYRTPVNIFEVDGDYVVALTYGRETDWVRNVVAAGGCELEVRGRRVRCTAPRLEHDPTAGRIRLPERPVLRLLGVADFLRLTPLHDGRAGAPPRG